MSADSLSFRLDELTDTDARESLALAHAHTFTLSFHASDKRHPHASTHSTLVFVSLFHILLHPHHSPYNT